jgi:hypothetical protein
MENSPFDLGKTPHIWSEISTISLEKYDVYPFTLSVAGATMSSKIKQ